MSLAEYRVLQEMVAQQKFSKEWDTLAGLQIMDYNGMGEFDYANTDLDVKAMQQAVTLGLIAQRILDAFKEAKMEKDQKAIVKEHKFDKPSHVTGKEDYDTMMQDGGEFRYLKNGDLHRLNGPAVIRRNGSLEYWLNGRLHTKESHAEAVKNLLKK